MKRSVPAVTAALLTVFVACGVADQTAPRRADGWVQVGTRAEWKIQPASKLPGLPEQAEAKPSPDRAAAAKTWRDRPDEDSALLLARAYYPEFLGAEKPDPGAALNPATALSVKLPERAGEPMEISTRGHTFRVTRLSGVVGKAASHGEVASFYSKTQLLAAAGPAQRTGGRMLAQRVEEYDVVEGGATHRANYRIELPSGISGLRDTGEYLEFNDGNGGPPVLRMHYPQVRNADGLVRTGVVGLRGVSDVAGGKGRFVAAGALEAELSIDLGGLQGPLVVDPGWSSTSALATARVYHTATLLPSGKVLVTGGQGGSSNLSSSELFDPASGTWTATAAPMTAVRYNHTATLLPSGKVLVAGGYNSTVKLSSAELFDPASGTWTATAAPMTAARHLHTATLLPSGKVLVAGGFAINSLNTAELFDPASGTWTATGGLATARFSHTATLLASGKVLVAGGQVSLESPTSSAELFDPASGSWTATVATMTAARYFHSATLLPSGKVLVAGGYAIGTLSSAELFDPASGNWTATAAMTIPRYFHTATLLPCGKVLVTAGLSGGGALSSAELFDPASGTWTATAAPMTAFRASHTATLLPSGKLLVAGGYGLGWLGSAELFDPASGTWTATAALMSARRWWYTATLLPSGKVLVAGGYSGTGYLSSAELFDPALGSWTATATMTAARAYHTATLLPSGKVLVAGGQAGATGYLNSAELFDPALGTWTATAATMTTARINHTATLLPSGKVLVAGGYGTSYLSSAELFDPTLGTWTATTGAMIAARGSHTATLLPSGKVLVAGGGNGTVAPLSSTELFDPALGTWTATAGAMIAGRSSHTANLLPSGKVLVAGGEKSPGYLSSAELFDPAVGTWTAIATAMTTARGFHTATLLPSGKVLVAGGLYASLSSVSSAEQFDPASGTWTATTTAMTTQRFFHTATLLPSGKVLVAGGYGLDSAELFEDTGASAAWRPTVTFPGAFLPGASAVVTGTLFRGVSGASGGGTNDSPTDFPRVSLQSIDSGRLVTLDVTNFSSTSATVFVPASIPPGRYILWVSANAIYGGAAVRVGPNAAPVAIAQAVTTAEDTAKAIALTGSDADADALTFVVVTQPAHGTLTGSGSSLTYTPAANYNGSDGFTFKANDGVADSAPATVSITVTAVNDAPVATAQTVTTLEDTSLGITLAGTDVDGDALTFTVVTQPAHGVLSGTAPGLTYTPAPDYPGADSFTFKANDGALDSALATVSITLTPVNDPPVFGPLSDQSVLKDSGTHLVVVAGIGPGGGADEAASQSVTLTATSSDQAILPNPILTGSGASQTLFFTPASNAHGFATITVTAKDDGGTANGGVDTFFRTFKINVVTANHPPMAQAGVATSDGLPVSITLQGQDVDNDTLTFTVLTQPAHGALTGAAPNLTYSPESGFGGVDQLTFKANDGLADSEPATFSIIVNGSAAPTPKASGCGCSGEGGDPVGLAAFFLAALALRRRRRHG
jgi:MYXO-CTERM domain-containing protein